MECFDYVASRNNEGVSLLLAGEDQAAVGSWTAALATAKDQLFRVQRSPTPEPIVDKTSLSGSPISTATCVYATSSNPSPPSLLEIPENATTGTGSLISASFSPIPNLHSNEFFIANHAISLSPLSAPPRAEAAAPVYMASVILNLALAYHRQGRVGGRRNCVQKAEKMYDMVIKLINDATMRDVGTALVVKAIALNNVSLIRYERGEHDHAREGLDYLSFLLQSDKITCRRHFDERTLNGILLNIFLLMNTSNIAPAA